MEIKLENVSMVYDQNKPDSIKALDEVNLTLPETGMVGIIGPSGSGKSTLLYALAGLRNPSSGNIFYDNAPLNQYGEDQKACIRKKSFGFIFQQHFLIDYLTAMENVLVPINDMKINSQKKAGKILEKLGLSYYQSKFPHQLSGGQCQRIAVARALINEPEIIFCDEPTAALDKKSAQIVVELLSRYKEKALIILVTHDLSILEHVDEILRVESGSIFKEGFTQ